MVDDGEQTSTRLRFPKMKKPASTCIDRDTFKKLAFIIQVQYAVFYKIPEALYLTSEEICAALCTRNKWIPVIDTDSHVRFPYGPKGLTVALSVRDLVYWLAKEKERVGSQVGKDNGEYDRPTEVDDDDDSTPQITERLDAIHVLNRVTEPNPIDNKRSILKRLREDNDDDQDEVRPSKRVRWEDLYYSASELEEEDSVTSSEAEDSPIEAKVAWKDHSYEDKNYDSDSSFTSCGVSEDTNDMKLEDRIGARLAYKYRHDHTEPRSLDSSSLHWSLHWSSEGEHLRVDEHDIRNAYDFADNDDGLQWKAYIIDDGDDDNSNDSHSPPSWTLEDILEVTESRLLKDLDKLHPLEERVSCGPMSPCGLSTDDSEEDYHPEVAFRRTSLYHRLPVTMRKPRSKYGRSMTGRFPIISKADLAYKRMVSHWRRLQNDILPEAYLGARDVWFYCDVNERIADAFAPSDRFEYDFHSEAWKHFAPFDFANLSPESEANQEYDSGDEGDSI